MRLFRTQKENCEYFHNIFTLLLFLVYHLQYYFVRFYWTFQKLCMNTLFCYLFETKWNYFINDHYFICFIIFCLFILKFYQKYIFASILMFFYLLITKRNFFSDLGSFLIYITCSKLSFTRPDLQRMESFKFLSNFHI